MNVKAILAEMNTTLAVMKIRSKKPPSLSLFLLPSLLLSFSLYTRLQTTRIFITLLGTKHQNNAEDLLKDLF